MALLPFSNNNYKITITATTVVPEDIKMLLKLRCKHFDRNDDAYAEEC